MDTQYTCLHCKHTGTAETKEVEEYMDGMNDRPTTLETFIVRCCVYCQSEDLIEVNLGDNDES